MMPNRNYRRGVYFERKCKTALEAAGWHVWRSPGSKSPADLIALKAPDWVVLVQCKTAREGVTKKVAQELCELAYCCGAIPVAMWRDGSRGPIVWTRLDQPIEETRCPELTK